MYFLELGSDGHRLRQVEVDPDGTAIKTGPDDRLFDPPEDLYNPELVPWVITAEEFEREWLQARREG